ncbi:hypothetical protein AVEN_123454-1 [Araneus ventricosus]|uniref:DNA helicase Pif1-like 2B domain-containing protein n=1 Tax=Araneus ventricosus TaxID=182803 RepID=A0A4Y2V723_ARAVE|nr:hypothetical protein AVEN_123454-1 [Araneus ventricosus]
MPVKREKWLVTVKITGSGPEITEIFESVGFLNSLELSGVPSDKLRLNVGVPELLIRNLDVPRLRNGARLQITYLGSFPTEKLPQQSPFKYDRRTVMYQRCISMQYLHAGAITTDDADVHIVKTAIETYEKIKKQVVVIGQDVDLLVLPNALTPDYMDILMLKEGKGKVKDRFYSSKDLQNSNFMIE